MYERKVVRGRDKLCLQCRQSILLEFGEGNIVSFGRTKGEDTISSDNASLVDKLAEWTSYKEDKHNHKALIQFLIKQKEQQIAFTEVTHKRQATELMSLKDELTRGVV